MEKQKMVFRDPIIKKVVNKFVDRSDVGYEKYKITLNDDNSDLDTWMNHLQEELMDAVNYIEKARQTLKQVEDVKKEIQSKQKKRSCCCKKSCS
jgi:hypothetical protein